MAKRIVLILFVLFQITQIRAQSVTDTNVNTKVANPDSGIIKHADTTGIRENVSVTKVMVKSAHRSSDTIFVFHTDSLRFSSVKPADFSHLPRSLAELLHTQPDFNFSGQARHVRSERFETISYDGMFYLLILMLFYFAVVKLFFSKYLANLLTLFFRASMRQQQLREQVLQSPFPSLLLNNLFIFSGGLYGAFLLRHEQFGNPNRFWIHFLYCAAALALLYLLKFLILKITGWIFNISRTVDTYLFVVFMTNKIIGIFLLPFLVLISFSDQGITEVAITISIIMVCIFYIYRFIASYKTLHKEIKISILYYFLYLCAFEIAPLLLIYKLLVNNLEKAY